MINRVVLVGRMTKDPVLRKTGTGASVTSFTVACDRRIKTEGQPTADFINCVCWNKVADNTAQFTHKGSLVGVEGRIQTRSYDDQSGRRVYVTEVVCRLCSIFGALREPTVLQPLMLTHLIMMQEIKAIRAIMHHRPTPVTLHPAIHWISPVMIYHSNW